ncbi:MAG TPA: flagellar export chaperone FliS [Polyangiaceae bacterium]|nr:flagellar export chaperone FliS [Polyangiaceae bacterium]
MNLPTHAALARYGAVKVTTANPGQILVMLYDGLLRFLREAQAAMAAKDRGKAGERISRAHAIIAYLLGTLDPSHAPALCKNLQSLYVFCMQRLLSANLEQDVAKLADVVRVLTPLRDAWTKAVAESSKPAAAAGEAR